MRSSQPSWTASRARSSLSFSSSLFPFLSPPPSSCPSFFDFPHYHLPPRSLLTSLGPPLLPSSLIARLLSISPPSFLPAVTGAPAPFVFGPGFEGGQASERGDFDHRSEAHC
eukprot:3923136-Rhodomonas_salina.1